VDPALRDGVEGIVALDCPVCPRRDITGETCPQCGTNLAPLARVDSLPRQYLAEGRRQLTETRVDRAIEFFGAATALDPNSAAAHAALGEAYTAKGWFDEASQRFESAIKLAPDDPHIREWCAKTRGTLLDRSTAARHEASYTRRLRVLVWVLPVVALSLGGLVGMTIVRSPDGAAPQSVGGLSGSLTELEAALNGIESLRGIRLIVTERAGIVEVAGDVPSDMHVALIREVASRVAGDRISLAALNVHEPSSPPSEVSYIVRAGDSFWGIASARYGSGALWQHVWEANRADIPQPEMLSVGQRIVLPSLTLAPR
jgi:nucleoid-associated protein YgaU